MNDTIINGSMIKKCFYKFFYKGDHLCFQVFVEDVNKEIISCGNFTDYNEYKNMLKQLSIAKASGSDVTIASTKEAVSTDVVFS